MLIENAPGSGDPPVAGRRRARCARRWGIDADAPVVLYTGTFEAYQGLDLLFAAAGARPRDAARRAVRARRRRARSGRGGAARRRARPASATSSSSPASGRRKRSRLSRRGDVLVSPRSRGTNTPLKIYQYLRSGRPIVATRLLTHTQVLDDEVAILTEATPDGFARGILRGDRRSGRGRRASAGARSALAETKYSYEAYLERTREACAELFGERRGPGGAGRRVKRGPLQLRALRRCGRGRGLRRAALRRSDRRSSSPSAGARADRRVPRRRPGRARSRHRHRHRARGDRAGAGAARSSPASTRRARCCASRRRARRERGARSACCAATRTRLPFADRRFDARVCLRVLMHMPDWRAAASPSSAASTRHRLVVDYPALASAAALQVGGAPRRCTRPARSTEAYRVFGDGAIDAVSAPPASASRDRHRQFVLPIALHKPIGVARLHPRHRGRAARASACCGCSARR